MVDLQVQGYPFIVCNWVLFAVVTPFVWVRLYVQLRFRARPWREIFVLVAWLLFLACAISNSLMNDWNIYNYDVDWDAFPDSVLAPALIAQLTYTLAQLPILYACKAALLCFYMELTPWSVAPRVWWVIMLTWPLLFGGVIIRPLATLLACKPISNQWHFSQVEKCFYHDIMRWRYSDFTFHLATDLIIYLLPFAILRNLTSLSRSQKRGVFGMFGLGFINILLAIEWTVYSCGLRIVNPVFDIAQNFVVIAQLATAIVIICLPYCRRFRPRRDRDLTIKEPRGDTTTTTTIMGDGGTLVVVPTKQSRGGSMSLAPGDLEKGGKMVCEAE